MGTPTHKLWVSFGLVKSHSDLRNIIDAHAMIIQLKLIEIQCVFHRPFRLMQSLRDQLSPTHHSAQPPILQADALTPGQRQEQTQNSEVKSRVLTGTCKQVWSRLSQRSRLGVLRGSGRRAPTGAEALARQRSLQDTL